MTNTNRLTGYEAIAYAEAHGLPLRKYTDPIEDARDDLTPAEARDVVAEDPALVYLDVPPGTFFVAVGDVSGSDLAQDVGAFEAASASEAALAAARELDPHRDYAPPELLSTSAGYGRGAPTRDGHGHGAQDRSTWFYVTTADGAVCGVFVVREWSEA